MPKYLHWSTDGITFSPNAKSGGVLTVTSQYYLKLIMGINYQYIYYTKYTLWKCS